MNGSHNPAVLGAGGLKRRAEIKNLKDASERFSRENFPRKGIEATENRVMISTSICSMGHMERMRGQGP